MPLYLSPKHDKILKGPSKLHVEAHLGRQAHPDLKSLTIDGFQEAVDKGMKIEDTTIGTEDAPKKPGPKKGKKPETTGSDEE